MDFALLGIDAAAFALAQAAVCQGHRLVWGHDLAGREAEVLSLSPGVTLAPHWEGLLGGAIAQAVIVASGDHEERAEQLRKLAAERVPLLVCHPVHSSTLLHLELDMIRRDVGGVIVPYIASRWHPAVRHVHDLLASGRLGPLEQLVCERSIATRDRPTVLRHFMQDVALLRQFLGDVTKVGAMAPAAGDAGFANLGVQLTGPSGVLARWNVVPLGDEPDARLAVVGSQDKVILRMPEQAGRQENAGQLVWYVEHANGAAPPQRFDSAAAPAVAIDAVVEAISRPTPPDDWGLAVRAAQLTEAVERSLRRGRVISLEFDEHTEEGTFKGVMATVGCGLLLFLPLLGLFLSIAAPRMNYHLGWTLSVLLVIALAGFLLMQLLWFVIPRPPKGQAAAANEGTEQAR
jgi:predicted dehydrogenase